MRSPVTIHSHKHPDSPVQAPVKAHVPPALVQSGMVGAPEYPELQVGDVQLPATTLVAVPVQPYPGGVTQAAATEECDAGGQTGRVTVMPLQQ